MGNSVPSANICQQQQHRVKHMAKLVKKGSKGGVGIFVTPGPSETPVPGGIAEIDFGVPAMTPAKAKTSKYPLVEGEGIEKLVDRIIELGDKFDAVDGPYKAAKKDLIEIAFPQFFEKNEGRMEAPSSMLAYGKKGGVRVTFKDQFDPGDKQKLITLLGEELAGRHFRQHWVVKVNSDEIPPEKGAAIVEDLKKVMAHHGVLHAMEIKAAILPNLKFAEERHRTFKPGRNMEINKIVPQRAAVSTKGVK